MLLVVAVLLHSIAIAAMFNIRKMFSIHTIIKSAVNINYFRIHIESIITLCSVILSMIKTNIQLSRPRY